MTNYDTTTCDRCPRQVAISAIRIMRAADGVIYVCDACFARMVKP